MNKAEMIADIIRSGKSSDLRDMLEGSSKFVTERSTGAPVDEEERKVWIMVVHHLRFLSEFGDQLSAEKDGRYLTPFPDDFECWLKMDAPGIAQEDLEDYVSSNLSKT